MARRYRITAEGRAIPRGRGEVADRIPERRFLSELPERVRQWLPPALQPFGWRRGFRLVKLYYGDPRIHFELWLHGKTQRIELGLHLEAEHATNQRLAAYLDERLLEVKACLGERLELEPWEKGWLRLYETIPLRPLDEALLEELAQRLAEMVSLLRPMYAQVLP